MKARLVGPPQPGGAPGARRGVLMHSLLAALLALLSYSVGHRAGLQDASKLAAAAARPWAPAAAKGDAAAAGAAAQAAAAVTATKAAGDLEAAAAVTAAGRGKGGKQKEKAAAASGRASGCSLPVDFQFDVAGDQGMRSRTGSGLHWRACSNRRACSRDARLAQSTFSHPQPRAFRLPLVSRLIPQPTRRRTPAPTTCRRRCGGRASRGTQTIPTRHALAACAGSCAVQEARAGADALSHASLLPSPFCLDCPYAACSAPQELYDSMWTGQHTYQRLSCWGCRFAMDVVGRLNFTTVLDAGAGAWRARGMRAPACCFAFAKAWCLQPAGPAADWGAEPPVPSRPRAPSHTRASLQTTASNAGNGQIVRVMRMRGKAAWGVELSRAVLERDAPDLLKAGYVEQGTLADLPFQGARGSGWGGLPAAGPGCSLHGLGATCRQPRAPPTPSMRSRAPRSCACSPPRALERPLSPALPALPACPQTLSLTSSSRPTCWSTFAPRRRTPSSRSLCGSPRGTSSCPSASSPGRYRQPLGAGGAGRRPAARAAGACCAPLRPCHVLADQGPAALCSSSSPPRRTTTCTRCCARAPGGTPSSRRREPPSTSRCCGRCRCGRGRGHAGQRRLIGSLSRERERPQQQLPPAQHTPVASPLPSPAAFAHSFLRGSLFPSSQDKETRYSRAKGDFTECRMEGEEADGGRFEVCVVNSVSGELSLRGRRCCHRNPIHACARSRSRSLAARRLPAPLAGHRCAPAASRGACLLPSSPSADVAGGAAGAGGPQHAVHHAGECRGGALAVCVHGG